MYNYLLILFQEFVFHYESYVQRPLPTIPKEWITNLPSPPYPPYPPPQCAPRTPPPLIPPVCRAQAVPLVSCPGAVGDSLMPIGHHFPGNCPPVLLIP